MSLPLSPGATRDPRRDRAPLTPAAARLSSVRQSPSAVRAAGKGRLLLVEDDQALRQIMKLELTEIGYEVKTAGSCREAREVMAGGNSQIAILDIGLPDGDGIDLACELAVALPQLRILLFSGSHSAFDGRPIPSAVLDCLTKPLSARQLDRVLEIL